MLRVFMPEIDYLLPDREQMMGYASKLTPIYTTFNGIEMAVPTRAITVAPQRWARISLVEYRVKQFPNLYF